MPTDIKPITIGSKIEISKGYVEMHNNFIYTIDEIERDWFEHVQKQIQDKFSKDETKIQS